MFGFAKHRLAHSAPHGRWTVGDRREASRRRGRWISAAACHLSEASRAAKGLALRLIRPLSLRVLPGLRQPEGHGSVRRLHPKDRLAIIFHFAKLDPEDRFSRFNTAVKFVSLIERFRLMDWDNTRFYGIYAGRRLVAVAELAADGSSQMQQIEVGLSVLKDWQRRGLGEMLLKAALADLERHENGSLVLFCSARNYGLLRLSRKLGGEPTFSEGQYEVVFQPSH